MEIAPNLFRLQVPIPNNPLGHLNVYAIPEEDGWTIVDVGINAEEVYRSLVDQIRALAGDVTSIRRIILTHWHPDHFGLAHRIKKESGARITMHEQDVALLNYVFFDRPRAAGSYFNYLLENGVPREELTDIDPPTAEQVFGLSLPFKPDATLRGGEKLRIGGFLFDVIWTPGHSPGHVCLYERSEHILISGDHVLPSITPNVSYHPEMDANPLAAFLSSLDILAQLDVALVLPAHEHPFNDLSGRLVEIHRHHLDRCLAILGAIGDSAKTAYEISSEIIWAEGEMGWADMPEFHRRMAVGETLAHLRYLRSEHSVDVAAVNGKQVWRRVNGTSTRTLA
jgi:glyoxylase-like metal-dependent hydrolase (beta-lactamase superfamily II)